MEQNQRQMNRQTYVHSLSRKKEKHEKQKRAELSRVRRIHVLVESCHTQSVCAPNDARETRTIVIACRVGVHGTLCNSNGKTLRDDAWHGGVICRLIFLTSNTVSSNIILFFPFKAVRNIPEMHYYVHTFELRHITSTTTQNTT